MSSDISPTELLNHDTSSLKKVKNRSKSISNAVLQHTHQTPLKKVSFSSFRRFQSVGAGGIDLTSSSITSSEDEQFLDSGDDEEEDGSTNSYLSNPDDFKVRSLTGSPSEYIQNHNNKNKSKHRNEKKQSSVSDARKNILRKITSYPMGGFTQSLDSQILGKVDSNSYLPAFNKRPLTDTPIVSSVASPETRNQTSDEEEDDGVINMGNEDDDRTEDESTQKKSKDKLKNDSSSDADKTIVDLDLTVPIAKTKNISHLNLTDLNEQSSRSVSPNTVIPSIDLSSALESPLTAKPSTAKKGKHFNQLDDKKDPFSSSPKSISPLQLIDQEILKEFEKSPSFEKLKSLLLTKQAKQAPKAYTLNIPGQTSSKISPDGKIASVDVGSKLVIVMVGLPARGKSYITNKLTRYLNWLQHDCRVFNVGNTRRKDKENNAGPEANPLPDVHTPNNEASNPTSNQHNADFFSPDNNASTVLREKWAMDTLDQLLNYVIDGPGSVGIFDATNSTKRRRYKVLKRIQERSNGELKVLYLESICSDPKIIELNIMLKLSGPDYKKMDPADALKDFVGRLHNYEKAYETIDESEESIPGFQYVKMINVGKKVVSYNIQGFLSSQTIYFLLNFNLCERQIWITRHGELTDNLTGRIGGDSHLTKRGLKFAQALLKFMNFQKQEFRKEQLERFSTRLEVKYNEIINSKEGKSSISAVGDDDIPTEPNFCVWTSMLYRAVETGQYFDDQTFSIKEMRMLNELGGGKFEGLTYEEIQKKHPNEFQARLRDKLTYRYPGVGGESYLDVLTRLRPLITEVERTTDNLLIVSHRVVLRVLLAYFFNLDNSSIGELDVPLHTLYCLELKPYGTDYRMYEFDERLNWFKKVEPDHQKNVKEVGVAFRERKYSVIPTAPPSHRKSSETLKSAKNSKGIDGSSSIAVGATGNNGKPISNQSEAFSIRRSLSFGANMKDTATTNPNPRAAVIKPPTKFIPGGPEAKRSVKK